MSAPPKYTCPSKTSSSKKVPLTGYPETSSDDEIPIAAKMSTALVVQAVVPSVVAPRDKKNSFPCPRDVKYVLAREDAKFNATRTQIMALHKEQGLKLTQVSGVHEACKAIESAIDEMNEVHGQLVPEFLRGVALLVPADTSVVVRGELSIVTQQCVSMMEASSREAAKPFEKFLKRLRE